MQSAARKETAEAEFGVLMAPVNGKGTWAALKELRASLRKLGSNGSARVIFVDALDGKGKAVELHDSAAVAIVLGYRLDQPA